MNTGRMDPDQGNAARANAQATGAGAAAGGRPGLSARSAMMSVVFAAMFLLALIAVYNVYDDWTLQQSDDRKKVMSVAEYCADQQAARTTATEILLRSVALSQHSALASKDAFYRYLRSIDTIYPGYIKFMLLRPDGSIVNFPGEAEAFPDSTPKVVRSRIYFNDILKKKRFVVGEQLDLPELESKSVAPMAMPLFDDSRHVTGILVTLFDVSGNEPTYQALANNYGCEIMFFDRRKSLLYRYPARSGAVIGGMAANKELAAAMGAGGEKATFISKDPFGNDRLYAMVKLRLPQDEEPYMYAVALTAQPDFIDFLTKEYRTEFMGTVLALLLSLWLASRAGRHFFSRGLEILARRTRTVKHGDFSSRIGAIDGCTEIRILAENMDAMLESIEQGNARLKELSDTDDLTGLNNRRRFYELANAAMRQALRGGRKMAVIMADLDHFKNVNDTYGHTAGDAVLRSFARLLRENTRTTDITARFGGEEFIAVLPDTDREGAAHLAEKLRLCWAEDRVEAGGRIISYTVSLGVHIFDGAAHQARAKDEVDELLEVAVNKADHALYASKAGGRNMVSFT